MAIINTIYGGGAFGGSSALQNKPELFQIELKPNAGEIKSWTDLSTNTTGYNLKKQTVENVKFETGYCYLISPSQDNYNTYIEYGIRGLDIVEDNIMEFVCYGDDNGQPPSTSVKVDILKLDIIES